MFRFVKIKELNYFVLLYIGVGFNGIYSRYSRDLAEIYENISDTIQQFRGQNVKSLYMFYNEEDARSCVAALNSRKL